MISLVLFAGLVYLGYPVTYVYDKFLQLATTAVIFSTLLSVYLYLRTLNLSNAELAEGGNSGKTWQLATYGHLVHFPLPIVAFSLDAKPLA